MSDRKLPHNLEAEQSVLGALLVDIEVAAGAFQILDREDFYSPKHGRLFEAIRTLYDRHSTVDEVMVQEELERRGELESAGGLEYLDELIERVPAAAHAEYYARIVRDKALLRSLYETCTEIVQGIYDSKLSAQEQQDRAEHLVTDLGRRGGGRDFIAIRDVIDEQFERFDDRDAGEAAVLTHFTDLDEKTTGFQPAQFVIVAGRPSMGKTTFCMNVVENAAVAGKCVAIFSLEVSRDQLVQNLLCSYCGVDSHRLRKRSLSSKDWQSLTAGAGQLRSLKIYIDDTPGLSPLALKAKARRLHMRDPLDLIVIDYLQLMESAGHESRQQEISAISRALKGLARELQVPIVTISQLSRGVETREDHRPRLSDLRESGAIEQDADLVLLLYRKEYYLNQKRGDDDDRPEDDSSRGVAEVIIAKQRNGPTGTVKLHFRSECMRFENLTTHDYSEEAFHTS